MSNAAGYVQWVVVRLVSIQTSGKGIFLVLAHCNNRKRFVTYESL